MPQETLGTNPTATPNARPVPAGKVFVVFECDRPLAEPTAHVVAFGEQMRFGRGEVRGCARRVEAGGGGMNAVVDLRIVDAYMSSTHATLARVGDRWTLRDESSRNGTRVNGVAQTSIVLSDGDRFELGRTHFCFRESLVDPDAPIDGVPESADPRAPALRTIVPALARDFAVVAKLSRSMVPLLIQAETGSGKELVARAAHLLSERKGPFVAVNCGALAPNLLESELFGYKKGAFSGATEDRAGLLRSADGGTLLLDEIADLSASAQTAMLRVLQEREVVPVGATRPVPIDVRVLAASHRPLKQLVLEGSFRADLLARISGFVVRLPPLRERFEDFGLIVAALLRKLVPELAPHVTFSPAAAEAMLRYAWPNNVRELERALEASIVLSTRGHVDVDCLPESIREVLVAPRGPSVTAPSLLPPAPVHGPIVRLSRRDDVRKRELEALLTEYEGNISAVARRTGKARAQIHRWLKAYGIDAGQFIR